MSNLRNAKTVVVSPGTTTDLQPGLFIWSEGDPAVRYELTLAASVLTFEADDAVDTSIGASGLVDMTAAAYNTATEVIAAVNADTDGIWKCIAVGALDADSTNATTIAQTEVTVNGKSGFYIQWDNSETNSLSITAGLEVLNTSATNALTGVNHTDVPPAACATHGGEGFTLEPKESKSGFNREKIIIINSFKFTPTYTGTATGTIYWKKPGSEITGPTFTVNASTVETSVIFDELSGYGDVAGLPAPGPGYHAIIRVTATDVSVVASEQVVFTYGDPE